MNQPAGSSPVLSFESLVVGYGQRRLNKPFTASVGTGELVSLLGANGMGKSTLLKSIAGELPPLDGNICLGGIPIVRFSLDEMARMISVVTTDRIEADALTVREVVEMGRYPYTGFFGVLSMHDREIVTEALAFVGICGMADRNVSSLSDGERQKVMIARALAQDTPVILLDEPTSYLDVSSRIEIMTLLRNMALERSRTVILSTHDVTSALEHSTLLWLMMPDGSIISETPDALLTAATTSNLADDASNLAGAAISPLDNLFPAGSVRFSRTRLNYVANPGSLSSCLSDPSLRGECTNVSKIGSCEQSSR